MSDILTGGYAATYLDEVTHLHWWFYPNEQNNPSWTYDACGASITRRTVMEGPSDV